MPFSTSPESRRGPCAVLGLLETKDGVVDGYEPTLLELEAPSGAGGLVGEW